MGQRGRQGVQVANKGWWRLAKVYVRWSLVRDFELIRMRKIHIQPHEFSVPIRSENIHVCREYGEYVPYLYILLHRPVMYRTKQFMQSASCTAESSVTPQLKVPAFVNLQWSGQGKFSATLQFLRR